VVLIDVSATAREAGIRWPVALTRAAWERRVAVPPGVECQDEAGRLWNVLWMLALPARRCQGAEARFAVHVRDDNGEGVPLLVRSKPCAGRATETSRSLPCCWATRVRRVTTQIDPFRRKEEFERNTNSWAIELTRRGNPKGTVACSTEGRGCRIRQGIRRSRPGWHGEACIG
jgi:hypothetical protein